MWHENLKIGDKVIVEYESGNDYKMIVKEIDEIHDECIIVAGLQFEKKNDDYTCYISGIDEFTLGTLYYLKEWTIHRDKLIKTRAEREMMEKYLNEFRFEILELTDLRNVYEIVQNWKK